MSQEYWIRGYGYTAISFEQPLNEEIASLIKNANPGYIGVICLCRELADMGVGKPVGLRTFCNVHDREVILDVNEYWPSKKVEQ